MKSSLKFKKISGVMKSRGEYETGPSDHRPYDAVTFVDNDGQTVYFTSLSIQKQIDQDIKLGKEGTFYILRYAKKEKMIGILYAAKFGEIKNYYPAISTPLMKQLALSVSARFQLRSVFFPIGAIGAAILGVPLMFVIPDHSYMIAMMFAFIGIAGYLAYPMLFQDKLIDINIAKNTLMADGFSNVNPSSNVNSPY